MIGIIRHSKTIEEAGHAVVARKLALAVKRVSIRANEAHALTQSASYLARNLDVPAQMKALEQDAIVALAGHVANQRERSYLPDLDVFDFSDDADDDAVLIRSAVYQIYCLMKNQPYEGGEVEINTAMQTAMMEIFLRLKRETAALVETHWLAIKRVAKHLERHGRIDDQATLDELIERAERMAQQQRS